MKIAQWSSLGFRLLMSSSVLIGTGHGGRDRMITETLRKYASISTNALELFKSLCQQCQKRKERETDRQTDRQTDRLTDRQRQRDRQTETERERQRETETETDRQTDRGRERETEADRQTDRDRQTETDRQSETDRQRQRGYGTTSESRLIIVFILQLFISDFIFVMSVNYVIVNECVILHNSKKLLSLKLSFFL